VHQMQTTQKGKIIYPRAFNPFTPYRAAQTIEKIDERFEHVATPNDLVGEKNPRRVTTRIERAHSIIKAHIILSEWVKVLKRDAPEIILIDLNSLWKELFLEFAQDFLPDWAVHLLQWLIENSQTSPPLELQKIKEGQED